MMTIAFKKKRYFLIIEKHNNLFPLVYNLMSSIADKALSVIMVFAPTIGYFDQVNDNNYSKKKVHHANRDQV